jgi:hypothetical protein
VSSFVRRLAGKLRRLLLAYPEAVRQRADELKLMLGAVLAQGAAGRRGYASLAELEFKVFSQFGDDGIIQYLTRRLPMRQRTFIEFGVEDYFESNTRFLLQNDNWTGFVMDGSDECMRRLRAAPFFWKHDLTAVSAFITRENIGSLIREHTGAWAGVDLLHIDLDGNDYWIWEAIELAPVLVIAEYNSVFGADRAVSIPYAADFRREAAHSSNLYWGASLGALHRLAQAKGYAFLGCNSAGNNAYFARRDVLNGDVAEVSLEAGYVRAKFRESRDGEGRLTFLGPELRTAVLRGLPVFDFEQGKVVPF